MLKIMRKNNAVRNTIIILVVIALAAYVLVGLGSAPPVAQGDTIAKFGSTKIQLRDALIQKENIRNAYAQLDANLINQFTVSRLVSGAILLDGAKQTGIAVSDEELRDRVIEYRTTPDGGFVTEEQWASYIKYNFRIQVASFENYLRDHDIKSEKFRRMFLDCIFVPEAEILERFNEDNRKAELEMLVMNTTDVKSKVVLTDDAALKQFFEENSDDFMTGDLRQAQFVGFPINEVDIREAVTDVEIQNFYNENTERYRSREQVQASHVLIKTDSRSEQEALTEIQRIAKEIADGLDFAEAAKKYSEDAGSKVRGGDLGKFGRGRMVPEFEKAAFEMENGAISPPIKTQFGYHIIKKISYEPESVRPLEKVTASIRNNIARNKARDESRNLAETFRAQVVDGEKGFTEIAAELGYEVKASKLFDEDNNSDLGEGLGKSFQARRSVFAAKELNEVSQVIDAGNQTLVLQWVAEQGPASLKFEEDKNRIRTIAEKIAGKRFIERVMDEVRAGAKTAPDKSFKELLGERDYLRENHFKNSGLFTAKAIPFELDRTSIDFEKDIFDLAPGDFVGNAKSTTDTRLVLCRLIKKEEADGTKLAESRSQLIESLRLEKGNQLLSSYIFARTSEYDPQDQEQAKILNALTRR